MLEHALVELKPSLARDGTPWLQPISDSTLSTTSSRSQLSDIDDYPCSMEDEYSNPATNTSTEMDLKDEESTSGPARKPSKVRWGSVDVRVFPIIPGDHPDCDRGPPLTIAWDHVQEFCVSLDAFEEERKDDRHQGNELVLSWLVRQYKLRNLGFPEEELKRASSQARQFRRCREWTLSRISRHERFEMFQESLMRKLTRGFRAKKKLGTKY